MDHMQLAALPERDVPAARLTSRIARNVVPVIGRDRKQD
jgi:hypothetical protein